MRFLILGTLEVRGEDGALALGGIKPRAVLAVLLLHANESVSVERLALALWGEEVAGSATTTVRVHVSRLRKALGDGDVITTTPAGYCLRVGPDDLDAAQFERLVEEGRRALAGGQAEYAAGILRDALAMCAGRRWRNSRSSRSHRLRLLAWRSNVSLRLRPASRLISQPADIQNRG